MLTATAAHDPRLTPAPERRRRTPGQLAARVAGGLVLTLAGGVWAFICLFVAAWQCDESCDDRSSAWRDQAGAWQWSAIGWLGVACFACSLLCALSLATRSTRLSVALFVSAVATGFAPWVLLGAG